MELDVNCRCNQVFARSLCCCASDDWFCPRCGERLSRLWSYNEVESLQEIWLYPTSTDDTEPNQIAYELELYLWQPGLDRTYEPATPVGVQAVVAAGEWKVTSIPTVSDDESPIFSDDEPALLMITRQTPGRGGSLEAVLNLQLSGNFPVTEKTLRLCGEPQLEWSLVGKGIEPRREGEGAGSEGPEWRFISDAASMDESSTLGISLISREARVVVKREIKNSDVKCSIDGRFITTDIDSRPPVGFVVSETNAAVWQFKINFGELQSPGQILRLVLHQDFVGRKKAPLELALEYRPTPVTVEPAGTLTIEKLLYWGETCSNDWENREENPYFELWGAVIPQVLVRNASETPIELRRPKVRIDPNREICDWLELDWMPGHADEDGVARLEPQATIPVLVRVKLPAVPPASLPAELTSGLTAEVWIQNVAETDYSPYKIEINQIRPRMPCPHPLVIDFGNTASHAAVMKSGMHSELEHCPDPILHVQGGGAQQPMPTVISIRELNTAQPLLSEFEIGNAAYGQPALDGRSNPRITVLSDLKRWLANTVPAALRNIGDDQSKVPPEVLVRIFLYGLIRRAEAVLRCYSINRIAVSYPAKFRPHARRRLQSLIAELCREIQFLPGRQSIESAMLRRGPNVEPIGIDEANAVATGAVLQSAEELMSGDESSISPRVVEVVASFDLGGGSLDTALIEFTVENPGEIPPEYSSVYLGIGGFWDFGGDNVTVAVFELLVDALKSQFPADSALREPLADLPNAFTYLNFQGLPRKLYDYLWKAAEDYKQWLCGNASQSTSPAGRKQWKFPMPPEPSWNEPLAALNELPTLDKVYSHIIHCDHHGNGDLRIKQAGYHVRGRLEAAISELKEFADAAGKTIDRVVLGGRGSQLPLVQELLSDAFPATTIVYDPNRLKPLVAEGLAHTVQYLETNILEIARSGQYTTAAIGVLWGQNAALVLIPTCTKITDGEFPFARQRKNNSEPLSPWRFAVGGNLRLFADVDKQHHRQHIGTFKLPPLDNSMDPFGVKLRFKGDEDRIELVIPRSSGAPLVLSFTESAGVS